MSFEECVSIVLAIEGGYTNNAQDPGGETKFGISKRAYPGLNIAALSKDDAILIYRQDYWDKVKLDSFPEPLRLVVFDAAVNQGVYFAVSTIQDLVGVKSDGVCGPTTLGAVLRFSDPVMLRDKFFYKRLRAYSSSTMWGVFGAGWAGRLLGVALSQ